MPNNSKGTVRWTIIAAAISITVLLAACQTIPFITTRQEPEVVPLEKQEYLALESYTDLLNKTSGMNRVEKRDILLEGFEEVIRKYPDSSFAHESYFHLIRHYLYNYDTPMEKEAEEVYSRYFKAYEDPRIGDTLSLEMAKYYYQFNRLDRLVSFTVPFMQEYVETGKMRDGLFLFYYSEAKFLLKDYREALRGYVTYSKLYSDNDMKKFVRKRLMEIRHLMEKEQ